MNSIDWIGAVGVFQILLAYLLNISGRIKNLDLSYVLLNLIGAAMACAASVLLNYLPFIILEAVWAIASLVSLIKLLKNKTSLKA